MEKHVFPASNFFYIYIYRGSCGLMGFFWIIYLLQYSEPVLTLAKVKGGHSYKQFRFAFQTMFHEGFLKYIFLCFIIF
jgi:hypothetical protein